MRAEAGRFIYFESALEPYTSLWPSRVCISGTRGLRPGKTRYTADITFDDERIGVDVYLAPRGGHRPTAVDEVWKRLSFKKVRYVLWATDAAVRLTAQIPLPTTIYGREPHSPFPPAGPWIGGASIEPGRTGVRACLSLGAAQGYGSARRPDLGTLLNQLPNAEDARLEIWYGSDERPH